MSGCIYVCVLECVYIYIYIYIYIYRSSITGRVIPKTQNMVLDTTLLNTQHYKVRIKGKVEESRNCTFPYTLDYGCQLYSMYVCVRARMYMFVYIIYACICVCCVCVSIYIYIYIYIYCVCVCVCVCI